MTARLLTLAAALCWAAPAAAERPVPPLTGPVVDEARLLDADAVLRLEALSRRARGAEGGGGVQLQYLIVRSLEGEALESYAMRVAEAWRLGTKGKDNGVLVLVAIDDRKVRIEVGGGIEGGLTDAQAGRIIRNTIAPAFRQQRHGDGLFAAGKEILAALGALPGGQALPPAVRPSSWKLLGGILPFLLFFGVPVLIFALRGLDRSPRRRGRWGGGPFIGGGWGGGGGFGGGSSGGGWSGGGGGFSGGGASGSW